MTSHSEHADQVLAYLMEWRNIVLQAYPKAQIIKKFVDQWSPAEYLNALDGSTRFAVILAVILSSYIFLSSLHRFSKMITSFAAFLIQFIVVGITVILALQYRDAVTELARQVASKLDL